MPGTLGIDWNAYGRFDKFFKSLWRSEKEYSTFLDKSKSMDYGRKQEKYGPKNQQLKLCTKQFRQGKY